tara:strand:+ start:1782 stop:2000 length:219 start_codon:yes stop_codon:yes gene_type:complete
MNTVTKEQAERLATDYRAFSDAVSRKDNLSISVWGNMLLNTQRELGIEMHGEELLHSMIRLADQKLKQREAA